jgi:hypothetical protein
MAKNTSTRPTPNPTGDLIISENRIGIGTTDNLSTLTVRTRGSFNLSGTLAKTEDSTTLTGTATFFESELSTGDRINLDCGLMVDQFRTVTAITSNTSLTVDRPFFDTESDMTGVALPSAARFDSGAGDPVAAINDSGHLGIGTAAPNGQLEVIGQGAGDFFGCPVGIRVHNTDYSDAWQLVMTTDVDGKEPGAAIWVTQQQDDGGATMTFSVFNGESTIIDALRVDAVGLHLQTAFTTGAQLIPAIHYTVQATDHFLQVDAGANGVTITLPPSGDTYGRMLTIIKTAGAGAVTIAPAANDSINGNPATKTITTLYDGLQLVALYQTWVAHVMTAA